MQFLVLKIDEQDYCYPLDSNDTTLIASWIGTLHL